MPIWRFQFPKKLIPKIADTPKGKCLTNNNLVWRRNKALSLYNEDTGGSYSYSLLPDRDKEQSGVKKNYSFAEGDLTDRRKAPKAGNVDLGKGSNADWIVSWKNPAAFNITFDLVKEKDIAKISIFYSGQLPSISLYASNDGSNWVDLKKTTKTQPATWDVLKHTISGDFGRYRWIQLRFGVREGRKLLFISEIDIWSK